MSNMDFIELTFGDVTSSSLGLYVVSNSGRYTSSLSPQFENRTTSVSGRPGLLYWGTDLGVQEFTISLATDGMTGKQLNKFKQTFIPGGLGKLSFAESAYKYYHVLLAQPPQFSFVPFGPKNSETRPSDITYKGEIEMSFTTLTPYAVSDLYVIEDENAEKTLSESGIPVKNNAHSDFPKTDNTYYFVAEGQKYRNNILVTETPISGATHSGKIYLYHAGNASASANVTFTHAFSTTNPGTSAPYVNWPAGGLTFGAIKFSLPRFFADINLLYSLIFQNRDTWATNKEQVMTLLRHELDGPAAAALINIANAHSGTGTAAITSLVTKVNTAFFSADLKYHFSVNGYTNQAKLEVKRDGVPEPVLVYSEDNAGATNGKYLEIAPSGVLPIDTTSRQEVTVTSSIADIGVYFKNTYV